MKALQLALYYLGRRARTEQELRDKLARKQIPPQEIEAVLAQLKGYGYIDDEKFARDFQRARNDYKPMGVQRIKLELRRKGIAKEILETVAAEKEEEINLALTAAETRLRQYAGLEPAVFERRMMAFLARRGFSYDVIKRVFERLQEGAE